MLVQGSHRGRLSAHMALVAVIVFAAVSGLFAASQNAYAAGSGSIVLTTPGSPVVQDFNTLANSGTTNSTLPTGWYLSEAGTSAANNDAYAAGTGSGNGGDVYSFGAAGDSERSFGTLRSGTLLPTIGGSFTNSTGAAISALAISYTGEQWRAGVLNRNAADRLDFQISTDATSLTTGTWTDIDDLDFNSPNILAAVGLLNGNAPANQAVIDFTISGLSIASDAVFWIRWTDFDIASSDDGLSIDSFSITPVTPVASGPVINEFSASTAGTDVEYVEVFGAPNTSYAGYSILEIEGDFSGIATGTVDEVIAVGSTDASGLWLANLAANALENGTLTLLLVEGFTGALNDDLDTNDDGTLDVTPWTSLIDSVAVNDGGATDRTYGVPTLTVAYDGFAFAPGGASRIPDGQDSDSTSDWLRNDFDLAGIPGFTGTPVSGEALNTPGAPNQAVPAGDAAPTVSSTPATGAANVTPLADIVVTFSEPVNVNGAWFQIACAVSGTRGLAETLVSGGPTVFTINPNSDFIAGEACTLTVFAAQVSDQDSADPPDAPAADYTATFSVAQPGQLCATTDTPIGQVQGVGSSPALAGIQTVQGVVVGDYEYSGSGAANNSLRGFYVQNTLDNDDDSADTSDGIFVFTGTSPAGVSLGQVVQVTGNVSEFANQTQLTSPTIEVCGTGTVEPVNVTLPVPAAVNSVDYLERFEGMLVRFQQPLFVTEHFQLGRFGQVVLSANARLPQPTNIVAPGAAAQAQQAANNLSKIVLDDDLTNQNPDPIKYGRGGNPLSAANTLRGGDSVTGLVGVLGYGDASPDAFVTAPDPLAFRVRAIGDLSDLGPDSDAPVFTAVNERPSGPPNVGGTLKVASFNVLNYFLTLDVGTQENCGPLGAKQECRGAENALELDRQQDKLIPALLKIDADVLGLVELENTQDGAGNEVEILADIVGRLNAATAPGTYAFIDTGIVGTDTIRVGLIYKPGSVSPVGAPLVDNAPIYSRPPVAQVFESTDGATFGVVVNHFKSKGCDGATGLNLDQGDGQGCFNAQRLGQANALLAFINSSLVPVDPDVLIIGDLNAYAKEDPIDVLEDAGFGNLIAQFGGPNAYSYVFDGQWGYLDHALASASLVSQVTGAADYHINADEPSVLDYNTNFKSASQIGPNLGDLFDEDEFRTSDHDPVIVGLNLTVTNSAPVASDDSYDATEDTVLTVAAPGVLANDTDGDNDALTAALLSGPSSGELTLNADGSFSYTPDANFNGTDTFTYLANDGTADSNPATVTISVAAVNDAPTISFAGGVSCAAGNTAQGTVRVAISDVDTPITSLTIALAPGAPAWASIVSANPTTGDVTIALTPEQNNSRSALAAISVSDGVLSAQTPIGLHVGTQNDNQINALTAANGAFASVPNIILGLGGQDRLTGGGQADLICGGEGDNRIDGGAGDDTLVGGGTQDRINGGEGNDAISGRGGDDALFGDAGNDSIDGGANNDRMEGGVGDDRLTGGSGTDRFDGGSGTDRATDPKTGSPERDTLVSIELIGP